MSSAELCLNEHGDAYSYYISESYKNEVLISSTAHRVLKAKEYQIHRGQSIASEEERKTKSHRLRKLSPKINDDFITGRNIYSLSKVCARIANNHQTPPALR